MERNLAKVEVGSFNLRCVSTGSSTLQVLRSVAPDKFDRRRHCVTAMLPVGVSISSIDWEHAESTRKSRLPHMH